MKEKLGFWGLNWLVFTVLALVWGSSFILMKKALENQVSSFQIASIRITSAGLVLFPLAIKYIKTLKPKTIFYVFLSGALGALIPAFLFCVAEEKVDSGIAGSLNSLTPIFVIVVGALFFQLKTTTQKIIGVLVAIVGSAMLTYFGGKGINNEVSTFHISLIIIATMLYGVNVNILNKFLKGVPSIQIAAVSLGINGLISFCYLLVDGYFNQLANNATIQKGSVYAFVLGVLGTAMASTLFFWLAKRTGALFASMVTYGIPFVALGWGFYFGETINGAQVIALLIILVGVYIATRPAKEVSP